MRLAFGIAVLACLTAGVAQAGPVQLTADQMRLFGVAALAHGSADQALAIAGALFQRDAGDSAALSLRAQALRGKGDLTGSEAAARAAWTRATTPGQRYTAATALAQALSLQGHRTAAQYWLRQAVQNAPNAGTRAQAADDIAYVRSQNPLHLQLDASLRPSNNVNNGTRETLLGYLFGVIPLHLPPEFGPLSGVAVGLGLSGDYRLGQGPRTQDSLIFALNGEGVVLSDAARGLAPAAEARDYEFAQIKIGWRHKAALDFGSLTTEVTLGHNWYGGQDLSNILAAEVVLDHELSDDAAVSLTAGVTGTRRLDRPNSSATRATVEGEYRRRGAQGQTWRAGVSLSRTLSDDRGVDSGAQGIEVEWAAAQPVFGLGLTASAGITTTEYRNDRQDMRVALEMSAKVDRVSYLGFSPVISVDYSKNTSNFGFNTTETLGLGLRLKSNF